MTGVLKGARSTATSKATSTLEDDDVPREDRQDLCGYVEEDGRRVDG
ncbi:unnamed protein product [Ectocarpus sp. 12 AP-2014]